MTAPTAKFEFGFGATWQTEPTSIGWVDLTSRWLQSSQTKTDRGASSARGQVDVGQLGGALKNADRYFDPTAASIDITTLRLTGASNSYVTTPDRAGLDIVGDLDVRADIQPSDWSPATDRMIVGKYGSAGQLSWRFRILTSGALRLGWSTDGTAVVTADSTVNLSALANDARKWVRATLDVNNGAGGYDVEFFTSDDGLNWTQLGATVTGGAPTSIFASTTPVEIGSATGGTVLRFVGDIHSVEIRDGIDGTVVANPYFGLSPVGTTTVDDGQQDWTLQAAASIAASTGPGPFYGRLLPGVPVRVTALPSGQSDQPVWYGSVAKWPQRYDLGNTFAWVPIEAYDGFDKLSRAKIPQAAYPLEVLSDAPGAYWRLDERDGNVMVDSSGNLRHGDYDNATLGEDPLILDGNGRSAAFDHVGDNRGQFKGQGLPTAAPATIEAWVKFERDLTQTHVIVVCQRDTAYGSGLTFSVETSANGSPNGELVINFVGLGGFYKARGSTRIDDGEPHHIVMTMASTAAADILLYVDGALETKTVISGTTGGSWGSHLIWCVGNVAASSEFDFGIGGNVDEVAVYPSALSAARVLAHYEAGIDALDGQRTDERMDYILDTLDWPAGLRDFEVGRKFLGPAEFKEGDNALTYLRSIAASETGPLFTLPDGPLRFGDAYWRYLDTLATVSQFTFTDTPGSTGYATFDLDLDDELLVNVARCTRRGGSEQVAVDEDSTARYGEADLPITDLLLRTDGEALSLAQWTVATRSTPIPRVPKIRVPLHAYSATDQFAVLGLDLGHRVTCERTPQGIGDPIELDFQIDGITNTFGGGEWWWEAYVSPVPEATVQLFLLSDSLLSGADVLAY